jgi:hypothetical protein
LFWFSHSRSPARCKNSLFNRGINESFVIIMDKNHCRIILLCRYLRLYMGREGKQIKMTQTQIPLLSSAGDTFTLIIIKLFFSLVFCQIFRERMRNFHTFDAIFSSRDDFFFVIRAIRGETVQTISDIVSKYTRLIKWICTTDITLFFFLFLL